MGLDLTTRIGRIALKNPVLAASGTFGHAREFEPFYALEKLGGIVTKTVTLKPRLGNPPPRIVETPSGMLNAIGLQNPGVAKFIEEKLPYLRKIGIPIIVSVMGYSVEEFEAVVGVFEKAGGFDGYEMNLSCPNVSYKRGSDPALSQSKKRGLTPAARMFAHDATMIAKVVSAVRKKTKRTLIAKLGPDVSDIAAMALAAEGAGADAVSLINTFVAAAIDVKTRRFILANKTGGLSGPCIRPIAVRMTWEAARAVKVPVVGIGGIMNGRDAVEFLIAGASAVQVGTANFLNPNACQEIIEGIQTFVRQEKIVSIKSMIGTVS